MEMDHTLKDVTVAAFRDAIRDAVVRLDTVQPADLREPLSLWLRATEERSVREGWPHLLGRDVIAVWNAARAILGAEVEHA